MCFRLIWMRKRMWARKHFYNHCRIESNAALALTAVLVVSYCCCLFCFVVVVAVVDIVVQHSLNLFCCCCFFSLVLFLSLYLVVCLELDLLAALCNATRRDSAIDKRKAIHAILVFSICIGIFVLGSERQRERESEWDRKQFQWDTWREMNESEKQQTPTRISIISTIWKLLKKFPITVTDTDRIKTYTAVIANQKTTIFACLLANTCTHVYQENKYTTQNLL